MKRPPLATVLAFVAIVGLITVVTYGIVRDIQRQNIAALVQEVDAVCKAGGKGAAELGSLCVKAENIQEGQILTDQPDPNDPEFQESEVQEKEIQDPENQNRENQERESQDEEIQDPDLNDPDSDDPEIQEPEIQDEEIQEPENQEVIKEGEPCAEGRTWRERTWDHDNDPMTEEETWLVCVKNQEE